MVLSLHKQPFVTTHFQFITAHFVRHCALKNALSHTATSRPHRSKREMGVHHETRQTRRWSDIQSKICGKRIFTNPWHRLWRNILTNDTFHNDTYVVTDSCKRVLTSLSDGCQRSLPQCTYWQRHLRTATSRLWMYRWFRYTPNISPKEITVWPETEWT